MKVVVVGSGVGSLASALRLRALGYQVDVLESCPDPGGRARQFVFNSHTFDAGPTVITAPWLFDELFELFGESRSEHIRFLPCNPWYRLVFHDGTSMDLVDTVEAQEREIGRLSESDAQNYRAYLKHCEELYRVGYEELGSADFTSISSMIAAIPQLLKLKAFRTLWNHTGRYFKDKRVRQAFSLQTLLVGGNPLSTTAIYGLIHAMERRGGIWFAEGGTGALINELIKLALRQGIRFNFNSTASLIETTKGRSYKLSGVRYSQNRKEQILPADILIWGGDPIRAYNILGEQRLSLLERLRLKTASSSMGLYVMYFKTKKKFHSIAHHTIILSSRWEGLLKDIFSGNSLPDDPSLYLHRPAATDPSFDISDGDLFYVLAPVPHLGNFNNWAEHADDFKKVVIAALEESVLPELNQELEFAEAVDPRYFHKDLHSHLGAGFSIAPTLSQSAWFRFHNRMDKVQGMYLCGAGVHPGGGLPGVATSAKVIERMIKRDFQAKDISAFEGTSLEEASNYGGTI
jgi:phytoene desaturase